VPLNIHEIRRNAESGSTPSQCVLGLCYLYGVDVEINYEEAYRFLSMAAEQRASRAVLNLGRMHAQGLGIEQNTPEAIRHFEAVAKPPGSSDAFAARIELARIFARGWNIPVDKDLALKWYSSAIEIVTSEDDPEEEKEARDYIEQLHKPR
jgi:uncharacterized protein